MKRQLFKLLILLTDRPFFEELPQWLTMLLILSYFLWQFLFWFLVLAAGWWVVKKMKQKQRGFTLIAVLLIIGTLVLTAGGVVVWKGKVFPPSTPAPVATPTPEDGLSPTPLPVVPEAEKAPPLYAEFGKTWVWTSPTQCLSNPWQRDWQQSHGDDASYPHGEEGEDKIIREYYQKQGVKIFDIKSKSWETSVCMSCACPQGYTLYLLISNSDVERMIELGFKRTQ